MSTVLRAALAAALTMVLASNAMAQSQKFQAKVKAFTAAEKMYFDRANGSLDGAHGGGGGGDGGSI